EASQGRPLAEGHPYLRAEVTYAVTHEGALHVEDVLGRRVRLLIEAPDAGASAAPEVAAIMGKLLGWSRRQRAEEARRYQESPAATSQALLPASASQPAQPPVKPESPAQPRSWLRSRTHGQPQDQPTNEEPTTPVPVPA